MLGVAPCQRVYKLAKEKLKGITAEIEALKRTERYLSHALTDWENRMQRASAGQRSNLLHSLTGAANGPSRKTTQFRRRTTCE